MGKDRERERGSVCVCEEKERGGDSEGVCVRGYRKGVCVCKERGGGR